MSFGTTCRSIEGIISSLGTCQTKWESLSDDSAAVLKEASNLKLKMYALNNLSQARQKVIPSFHGFIAQLHRKKLDDEALLTEFGSLVTKLDHFKTRLKGQVSKAIQLLSEFKKIAHEAIEMFGVDFIRKTLVSANKSLFATSKELETVVESMISEYSLRVEILSQIKSNQVLSHKQTLANISMWIQQPYFKELLLNEEED